MLRSTATAESKTEIRIQLKDTTSAMLENTMHNELVIQVQPEEGVRLKMNAKYPGLTLETVATELDLTYKDIVEDPDLPEAYEALLRDALMGDFSLSVREDELEASWKIFTPLLHHIEGSNDIVPMEYPYGLLLISGFVLYMLTPTRVGRTGESEGVRQKISVFGRKAIKCHGIQGLYSSRHICDVLCGRYPRAGKHFLRRHSASTWDRTTNE